jgi:hypothetical protein
MKRWRIVPAVAGMAVFAVAFALLWPHARDSYAVLGRTLRPPAQFCLAE